LVAIWMFVAAGFALLNTVLILVLLWLYSSNYMKIRTTFTMGLILFVIFFLAQNISIIVLWYQLYSIAPIASAIVNTAAPYMTVINLVEAIALLSLVRISVK
jgi:hypothetical protein